MPSTTILLNGEPYQLEGAISLQELLRTLELGDEKVAVERNREIVPRSLFSSTALQEGDQLEIVHFIGGG